MISKIDCPYCDGVAHLKSEIREISYKKGSFPVEAHYYQCEKCHEEFTTTETDTQTMAQL